MADDPVSRRAFLSGRAAAAAAADAVQQLVDSALPEESAPPPADDRPGEHIVTLTRRAMACDFDVRLCVVPERNDTAAGMAALDLVERIEDQLTVYRERSELIDLNNSAASGWIEVEPDLCRLLELAGRLYEQTDGAFDLTSDPLSRVWGFHRRAGRLPDQAEIEAALRRVGWRNVQLDPERRRVRFAREAVALNVNSIGKGHALDRAGEVMEERGVEGFLMHGGRSTLLARGDNRLLDGGGWQAGVRDPLHPERRVAVFTLRDEALSTSGDGTQHFEHAGRRYGHVIDPRTGWPVEGLLQATVLAPTAAEADALSTAAFVLGVEGTAGLCRRRPDVSALLLARPSSEAESGAEVHAFNLDERDWRPPAGGAA